nr:MAG TPA: hypothetical protein [Caudoviricetes sp.]
MLSRLSIVFLQTPSSHDVRLFFISYKTGFWLLLGGMSSQ